MQTLLGRIVLKENKSIEYCLKYGHLEKEEVKYESLFSTLGIIGILWIMLCQNNNRPGNQRMQEIASASMKEQYF